MNVQDLMKALHTAEQLKDTLRHCDTSGGRRESVAEHSWRVSLMAYWISDEFPEADMNKVIKMCLIHDLGECFTGDIPTFDKTKADEQREEQLLQEWVDQLPSPFREDISTWADHEYELQRTYGNDKVQFSEYLKTLRQEVLEETEEKIITAVYAQMNSYK